MKMNANKFKPRKHLNADALILNLRSTSEAIPDPTPHTSEITLADALMSGFAMFSLKDPSLLAFQNRRKDENMKHIFHIKHVPCDTYMRELLDEVDPFSLSPAFTRLFAQVQRGKVLDRYRFFGNSYLLLSDGVEYHNSMKIHCPMCLQRHHRNGSVSYYHQMIGTVIAHPDLAEVIPLMPEPIQRQDGGIKGDCERNASKRMLERISKEHPHLHFIFAEDGLSSNGPHIKWILSLGWGYILVAKPKDHTELFARVDTALEAGTLGTYHYTDRKTGTIHCYHWLNQVPLNASHPDLLVNFLEYWEIDSKLVEQYYNSWVTHIPCRRNTVERIQRGGRARWKVENETFNTLKNQGYHLDHNFGHGKKTLSVVLALLMMLAFLVDQIQQLCNPLFLAAWSKCKTKKQLWEEIRTAFRAFDVRSMGELYEMVYFGYVKGRPEILNSS
jgi:hypothetical protein